MVFNIFKLSFIATPLVGMLSSITGAIPNILKVALLLAAGWVIASLLAMLVRRAGKSASVGRTLTKVNAAKAEADTDVISSFYMCFHAALLLLLLNHLS
ncbi:mechanosensitive ion channel family protein [Priestia abyssalis]|uniref:mechanosensitive ion channel family protein n=1 Tax=Priestia abyssalis TaxID=1221450 RepID=UPI002E265001